MIRDYIDEADRQYLRATKAHMAGLMARRGIGVEELAAGSGIPETTLRRWLSESRKEFCGLLEARRLAEVLEVSLIDMVVPFDARTDDQVLRNFLALPPHVQEAVVRCAMQILATPPRRTPTT